MVAIPSATPLTGLVKSVPSGDTLLLMKQTAPVSGPPPEMRLTLSSLKAPLLSRDGTNDESHAWASREYLREKLIGKVVTFRIDYRLASANRIFATVFLSDGNSVNLDVVSAGMARVRKPAAETEECSPEFDSLLTAEEKASAAKIGLHAGGAAPVVRCVPIQGDPLLEGEELVSWCHGRSLKGIVEYVANGSALKVFVKGLPQKSHTDIGDRILTLCLSGVQCPGFRRPEGSDPSTPPTSMPYAVNARFLTEVRLLNRDVNVSIEGVDRNGMLFATIVDPRGKMYIGEELLRAGFAKTVGWSIDLSNKAASLRAAERSARDRQLGVWKGFKAPTANSELFTGRCVEVVSGDMIVVLDDNTGKPRRISLASVRASRAERPSRDRSTVTIGPVSDAKESLRKKLIGRRVKVKVEYTRGPSEESVRKDTMVFATVSREGDKKNTDVALPMISTGLLSVVRHRGEEDRAGNYEEYVERQKTALETRKGMHGDVQTKTMRVNNLTGPDAKKRSRDVLSGLQRNGPHKGIVEYVSSASRYRVFLPSESMLITLALKAVRCPQSTRRAYGPDGSITDEVPGEPHGDDAADYAREQFMQRDVEVDVHNVDRVGAFLGNVYVLSPSGERTDVSAQLLGMGHGYLHESFDPSRDHSGSKYLAVEKEAKDAKKGVWEDYEELSEEATTASKEQSEKEKTFVGVVCEIGFGGKIFVQNRETSKAALSSVESGLASMSLDSIPEAPLGSLRPGLVVAAKFSGDQRWYRARVLYLHKSGTGGVDVRFIDYGNEERVTGKDIRRLSSAAGFISTPGIAVEVELAYVVVPAQDDPCGVPAGEFLRELAYGKEVKVSVLRSEGGSKVIGDVLVETAGGSDSSGSTSMREEILKSGLARIVRKRDRISREAFNELRPFEEVGIASRQYLWNYGEAFESDCDEEDSHA